MNQENYSFPATTCLESARDHLARLTSSPATVPVLLHGDHFDFLLQVQHWCQRGFFMCEDSLIERESDGACLGVVLHKPRVTA